MAGVPYCFEFYQDFSCVTLNGKQIQDVPARDLFELINQTESANTFTEANHYNSQRLDYQRSEQIWAAAEKWEKAERAFEKHSKKISGIQAGKNLDRVLKDLGVDV